MIGYLRGLILYVDEPRILLDCGGVGYEVSATRSVLDSLGAPGEEAELFVYTLVREDELRLFGFKSRAEKAVFELLTGVSGVGPRSALTILSGVGEQGFVDAVATGNILPMTRVKGIGKRTAERIVLELKDKVAQVFAVSDSIAVPTVHVAPNLQEAEAALLGLGFRKGEIANAFKEIKDSSTLGVEALIKEGLRRLR